MSETDPTPASACRNIRASLRLLDLHDLKVVGKKRMMPSGYDPLHNGKAELVVLTPETLLLSELCGGGQQLARNRGMDLRTYSYCIEVFQGDAYIGYVDPLGRFSYAAARDLRTALGWAVATDLGQERPLTYDLPLEAGRLEAEIRHGIRGKSEAELETFFFADWQHAVRRALAQGKGSRFENAHLALQIELWRVGTRRILSRVHIGFAVDPAIAVRRAG
mgnify:CR=1 FL=1